LTRVSCEDAPSSTTTSTFGWSCRQVAGTISCFSPSTVLDDLRLLLAPCDQDDALGAEYRAETHRDGLVRYVVDTVEDRGGRLAAFVAESYQPGAGIGVRAGLVEADLSLNARAENHQVDAVVLLDLRLVLAAESGHFVLRQRTVRDMDVLGGDVHQIEQALVDRVVAALELFGRDREKLVETEYDDVPETQTLATVQFDQGPEYAYGRLAGGDAQHAHFADRLFLADAIGDFPGDVGRPAGFVLVNVRVDFFEFPDDVGRVGSGFEAAFLRQLVVPFHHDLSLRFI